MADDHQRWYDKFWAVSSAIISVMAAIIGALVMILYNNIAHHVYRNVDRIAAAEAMQRVLEERIKAQDGRQMEILSELREIKQELRRKAQ